jgi:hypothetical protein
MSNATRWAAAAACLLLVASARNARALDHAKPFGEPFEFPGKRIVFTTWYWVRQGQTEWVNAAGKSVFADKQEMAGPYDAHFENIDGPRGVRLIAEQARRGGKLEVKPQHPWEANGVTILQMLPTPDGKIRAWAECTDAAESKNYCYLESTDAITWLRPKLGLVDYQGSKENNLVPSKVPGRICMDPHGPPEERFKCANNGSLTREEFEKLRQKPGWRDRPISMMALEDDSDRQSVVCVWGHVSPDGFRWTRLEEPLTIEESDGDQTVYWDDKLNKYVMYLRAYSVVPRAPGYPVDHARRHKFLPRRAIARTESEDFRRFPLSDTIIEGSNEMGPTDTYYLNARTTIPGAPDQHLMFPTRYVLEEDNTALDLYTSFDGKLWHIAPGCPLMRTAEFGQWDGGCMFFWPHLIERGGGDWVLLYKGDNFPHKYPRGKRTSDYGTAVWPKGRLMAIEAVAKGAFTTPAFLAPGEKVRINALTSRVGEIRVEAADLQGKPIAGRSFADSVPIVGDQHRTLITWKRSDALGVKTHDPLLLRFQMDKAKIYGLEFE